MAGQPPFFSFLKCPVFPSLLFHCSSSSFVLTQAHAHHLSVFLPLCLPDFHPPLWTLVPEKGPQLIPLLHCSSCLASYYAQDKCSWGAQEVKAGGQSRRQRSEPGSEQQTWSLDGLATVFWHVDDHKAPHGAEKVDVRACQCKCEKSPPQLLSLVLRFLTFIAS